MSRLIIVLIATFVLSGCSGMTTINYVGLGLLGVGHVLEEDKETKQ